MKQWYEKKYFHKMYWIFEELENLNLNHTEACLILMIQYFNGKNLILINKTKTSYDKYATLVFNESINDVLKQIKI